MTIRSQDAATKRDVIAQELRRRVLVGEYERGARLRQDELAANFGVSITPVREALRVLESEGLLISEPHKGVRVAGVDLERVEAIYVSRRLLESFAVKRASIRMSRKDLAKQQLLLDGMADDIGEVERRELNRDFHFGFYLHSGITQLPAQIATMWDAFPWDLLLAEPNRASSSQRDHEEILRAVADGDADAASRAMQAHIASSYSALLVALGDGEYADPFDE